MRVARSIGRTVGRAHPPSTPWEQVERIENSRLPFPPQRFLHKQRHRDPPIVNAFGTATPNAGTFLLHRFPGWDRPSRFPPVLLVHGARVNADCWVSPPHAGSSGMAQFLSERGFRVFALTFPHPHGDNFSWTQNIADAIKEIKQATGAEQVDLVAHSKGGTAARAYVSNLRGKGMDPHGGDVRRLVLLGAANLGIDYPFRHPVINLTLWRDDPTDNAPMSWDSMLTAFGWRNTEHLSIYTTGGNYFPGSAQLLSRFDREYPLPRFERDWYTTYYGGRGSISTSRGIEEAIREGGKYMERLAHLPVDQRVEIAVLAGSRADIPGVWNEHTGPSDGVVFTSSALATSHMTRAGAKVIKKEILPLNHIELLSADRAKRWVAEALSR